MDTLNKLLDQAKQMCSRDSDNCLAQTLGLQRAAVSKWRHGGKISPEELAKVIVLAQADPGIAVLVLAEQADDATTKKLWGPLWDRLSPVTTVIGALALVAIGMHAGAHEALLAALSPVVITDPLYIMRSGLY